MNRTIKALAIGTAALLCTTSLAFAAPSKDAKAVARAADGFYKALNVMFTGDLAPMTKVWSHADDVTYMGPGGGFQTGWAAVQAEFQKQADMKLGGHVGPTDMTITAGATIGIVSDYERGENTNAAGKTETVSLRATSLFRKEHGVWKMIGHHTDTLPYLNK
jgi:ketosteroid isomerase-like protein